LAQQKDKYSNSCVVRKKYSERNKKPRVDTGRTDEDDVENDFNGVECINYL
jgi:hypothetical protein